jgi:hypothetical protein
MADAFRLFFNIVYKGGACRSLDICFVKYLFSAECDFFIRDSSSPADDNGFFEDGK